MPVTRAASTALSVSVTTSVMLDLKFKKYTKCVLSGILDFSHRYLYLCFDLLVFVQGLADGDTGIPDEPLDKGEHLTQGLLSY